VTSRKDSFDAVARAYDAHRPEYPEAMFDEIEAWSGIARPARVLEIGPGTGKATVTLARRGHGILGVELGPNLAAVARERLAGHPRAEIVVASFEEWPERAEGFDLAVSAQAFHWIDPAVGYAKVHRCLRPGGAIALFWDTFAGHDEPYFTAAREVYLRHAPQMVGPPLTIAGALAEEEAKLRDSALFAPVATRRYPGHRVYPTARYLAFLDTQSDHRVLPDDVRAALFADLARLIDGRFGGKVHRPHETLLVLGRK